MTPPRLVDGGDCAHVPLPAILDMTAARPLKAAIAACAGRDVDLNGSTVTHLGGQCLQVILAAVGSWTASGRCFRIVDPSPDLIQQLKQLGVKPGGGSPEVSQ